MIRLIKCVEKYTAPKNFKKQLCRITYRIGEFIKGIFGVSDWQKAIEALMPLTPCLKIKLRKNKNNQKILDSKVLKHTSIALEILIEKNGKNDGNKINQLLQERSVLHRQIGDISIGMGGSFTF